MMTQYSGFLTRPTNPHSKCGPGPANGAKVFPTAAKKGVYFDFENSVAKAPKENEHDAVRCTIANTEGGDGWGGGRGRPAPRNTLGHNSLSRPSVESRLCQHVEYFVNVMGGPMAEGRHLLQLLQLEFRDVVRRSEQAEAEATCLRDRVRHAESYRREKDAADRASFAGMVLAHSDVSAELRSRLQVADDQLQKSEADRQAQADEIQARECIIGELERKIAQLVTSARIKNERENRSRLLWEQRISSKWEAYWAVRRPKAEAVSETTKAIAEPARCRSPKAKVSTTREESTSTKEQSAVHADSCRGDRLYVWEEERHEETVAAASTCHCAREFSRPSWKHVSRASAVPNAVAASEDSGAVSPHHMTRCGRPSGSSRGWGSNSALASTSASSASSPSPLVPGSATGVNNQNVKRDNVRNAGHPHNDDAQGACSSSHQQRVPPTTGEHPHHRGLRRNCRGKTAIAAAASPHPGSVRVSSSPDPSTVAVKALSPSRYRNRAEEGHGKIGLAVTREAVDRDDGVAPIHQDEALGRPGLQGGGSGGGVDDGGTTTPVSPGLHVSETAVKSQQQQQKQHHRHQATAQAIGGLCEISSPWSSISPWDRFPQETTHGHQHEPFRRAGIADRFSGKELVASPAPAALGADEENLGGGGRAEEKPEDAALVTAADVAAAAEAVAMSFALRSPGSPTSLQQQQQQQQQVERRQQQYHDHQHRHPEQRSPALSSLSCATEIKTLPRSDWLSPSGRWADLTSSVPAGAGDAAASEYTPGHAGGGFDSSSLSRSSRSRSDDATGSRYSSDPERARQRWPGTTAFASSRSGSHPIVSPASSGRRRHPPRGYPNYYDEHGGSRFSEHVRSTRSDPSSGRESSLLSSWPGASRGTPRSCAFSCTSGYSSRSRQGPGNTSGSSTTSTEDDRSAGSSMCVSSSNDSVSGPGSAPPSRLGCRPRADGRGGDGGGSSVGYAREQPERRPDGVHNEMGAPLPRQVQGRRDDGSATSAAGVAHPTETIGSRVSSRSSLHGEKFDCLSVHRPPQMTGNRQGQEAEEEHRQAQGQKRQDYFSSPSLSPLSSPLASPPGISAAVTSSASPLVFTATTSSPPSR